MQTKNLIVKKLEKGFPGRSLLFRELSFTLSPGQKMIVAGPNGGGKSVLLECLTGCSSPGGGEVSFDSVPLAKLPMEIYRKLFGYQRQPARFPYHARVGEILALFHRMFPSRQDRYASLLSWLLPLKKNYCERLSNGENKLLSLYLTLISPASIVVLDEPTTGLDSSVDNEVFSLLKEETRTLIVATHRLKRALSFCDQVCFLAEGQWILFSLPRDAMLSFSITPQEESSPAISPGRDFVVQGQRYLFREGNDSQRQPIGEFLTHLVHRIKGEDEYV